MSRPAGSPPPVEDFLQIQRVSKRFGDFAALSDVTLSVRSGELLCLLGPSGSGKTTLLRIVAGLEAQSSGTLIQAGRDISRVPALRRDYGIVFQSYALFPNLSVADNVAYGLVSRGARRAEREARVRELLALVGLPESGRKYPAQLSGGEQQRVAIARALAISPGLLLLDEPLSALDARVRARLRGEIRALQQRLQIPTLLVTHDQEEALSLADRIAVMNGGAIEQVGTPEDVYRRPATAFVADFVGRGNLLPARRAEGNRWSVGDLCFACAESDGAGDEAQLFFRPEDVRARGVTGATPNSADARVESVEFLGAYSRVAFRLEGVDRALCADLSENERADLAPRAGDVLRLAIPPERLRVLPAKS